MQFCGKVGEFYAVVRSVYPKAFTDDYRDEIEEYQVIKNPHGYAVEQEKKEDLMLQTLYKSPSEIKEVKGMMFVEFVRTIHNQVIINTKEKEEYDKIKNKS